MLRKEIYELKYPETKQGVSQAKGMNKSIGNNVSELNSVTFVKDTAKKLDVSERKVEQELQIAKNIVPEVKEVIKQLHKERDI